MPSILNYIQSQYRESRPSSQVLYKHLLEQQSIVQRLVIEKRLKAHQGCVNTIQWNESGDYILSGSDDLKLVICNPFNGRVAARIPSGHRANIFRAKFLPGTGNRRIISCSADGGIRYTQLDSPSLFGKTSFKCHKKTVYEVATIPNDENTFLSCSEDGTIRWFDLREKTSCECQTCFENVLVNLGTSVTCLSVDPLRPYYFASGSGDGIVRIFDCRSLHTHGRGSSDVVKMCKLPGTKCGRITSLCFNNNGSCLLANSAPRYIYEIDAQTNNSGSSDRSLLATKEDHGNPSLPQLHNFANLRVRLQGDWTDTGPTALPASERGGDPLSTSERLFRNMSSALTNIIQGRAAAAVDRYHMLPDTENSLQDPTGASESHQNTADIKCPETRDTSLDQGPSATPQQVSQMGCLRKFEGHRNARTSIKQCSYWGEDLVVSGSDCGHIFVWRKSGELILILPADKRVVNCVQPNPFFPMLASSGIDHDIKIWTPTSETSQYNEELTAKVVDRNRKILEEQGDVVTVPAVFMLRLFAMLNRGRLEDSPDEAASD